MERITRRRALQATGSAGVLALAGCIDDGLSEGDPSHGELEGEELEYDVFQIGPSLSRPPWATDEETTGFVTLIENERDQPWMIDDPDEVEGLEEWYTATDFDESVIVCVRSVGPNTCYDEVAVSDVRRTTATLDGEETAVIAATAEAVDTSEEDVECGQAVTYPAALVRVTDDDLPAEAAFTVTDGWGETADVDTTGGVIDPDDLPGYVRPSGDPRTVPDPLVCDGEFERHWSPDDDVAWGELVHEDGDPLLAMRIENPQYGGDDGDRALEFERGDEVRVTMRTVADRPVDTGNRNKYGLEVLTEDGWMDVRGTSDDAPMEYTDEAIHHLPGEGFEWTFVLTDDGVLDGHVHEDRLEVCPGLPEGRYRFAFWGAIGDESLAVAFDLVG